MGLDSLKRELYKLPIYKVEGETSTVGYPIIIKTIEAQKVLEIIVDLEKTHLLIEKEGLQNDILRIDVQRTKTLQNIHNFYERLPNIKDPIMAMTEFQEQMNDLIDYTIEIESVLNKFGMEDELRMRKLIANRPNLPPPEYKWRKGHQVRKELLGVEKQET